MSWTQLTLILVGRAIVRPRLALALLTVAWRFRRKDWYKLPPFLPLPSTKYVSWRMHTAYGNNAAVPPADDVVRYALWAARS